MDESPSNEVILFNILEELYALNHTQWKNRIMLTLLNQQQAPYRRIKEKFLEIPDMLVYRCIRELMMEGMILRNSEDGHISYSFTQEGKALAPILAEIQQ